MKKVQFYSIVITHKTTKTISKCTGWWIVPKKDGVLVIGSIPSKVTSTFFCSKRTSTKNFASSPNSSPTGGHYIQFIRIYFKYITKYCVI